MASNTVRSTGYKRGACYQCNRNSIDGWLHLRLYNAYLMEPLVTTCHVTAFNQPNNANVSGGRAEGLHPGGAGQQAGHRGRHVRHRGTLNPRLLLFWPNPSVLSFLASSCTAKHIFIGR